jgi:hypothetical protein
VLVPPSFRTDDFAAIVAAVEQVARAIRVVSPARSSS